jgi:8-oxo-dGTP pyrophosphatase MutT (NUDIX family)
MNRTALCELIAAHEPADDTEARHLRAMSELLDQVEAPWDRRAVTPGHFTASAFVLSPDGERLLLIHHAKLGRWLQPGGHIDDGDEDVFAAALREVAEETGVRGVVLAPGRPALLDVDVHEIPARPAKGEAAHRHYDLRVLLWALDDAVQAGSDALAARWVPLDQVADWETDASVLRAVESIVAWRRRVRGSGPSFSPAAERNRGPIAEVLSRVVAPGARVLEIASGTGQHAVWLAEQLAVRWWQPSDLDPEALISVEALRLQAPDARLRPVTRLDVGEPRWLVPTVDLVFCANMTHISPWSCTLGLLAGAARALGEGGLLALYGPFLREGVQTAPSNLAFDASLRARDARWGLRSLEQVTAEAERFGLTLEQVVEMPANNLTVLFRRRS